jgi:hypothetical protein
MTVDLKLGATIEHAVPRPLSISTTNSPTAGDPTRHMWSVASDGSILVRVPLGLGATGGGAQAATLPPQFVPVGQSGASAANRSPVTSGLTAILHWTSLLRQGGK